MSAAEPATDDPYSLTAFAAGPLEYRLSMEQLSIAYIRAVASTAGFTTEVIKTDVNGVDLKIGCGVPGQTIEAASLNIQAKSTGTRRKRRGQTAWSYPTERSVWESLASPAWGSPVILVVLYLPSIRRQDWIHLTAEQLVLRGSAFWTSLRGQPCPSNSPTVSMPYDRPFSPSQLAGIIGRIRAGGLP